ncbi:MAG: succinylglutamate desuccinylase/aspartoacylase family protein, partial [Pseudoxanthomonas sp.]|nr:succinylglutamate desuccinylase/aspartoacylase family protein [Pseudoxanthomonas sp.]
AETAVETTTGTAGGPVTEPAAAPALADPGAVQPSQPAQDTAAQGVDPGADDAGFRDDAQALLPADPPEALGPPLPDPEANIHGVSPLRVLGAVVNPGHRVRLSWTTGQSFSGSVMETPVVVVHGERPGPRLCLTAGTHGDELNGVEVVRRIAYKIEPTALSGTVIAVPIVNLLGFSRGSRYLPDRRDLNRFFPGNARGSSASRIAASFFEAVIDHCDALVDFHTGSFDRANLPQVRGDLTLPAVVEFTRGFGATAVLHSPGAAGMLRTATTRRGIPAVTFEIGGPKHLQPEEIEHGERAIDSLMFKMGMVERRRRWAEPQAVFYESRWIRADQGGMLFSEVRLGDRVAAGQRLGQVIDPVSNRLADIKAPEDGRIIGMALNQLVLPGFAAYHLGIAASEERVVTEAELESDPDDERFLEYDQLDSQDDELDDGPRDGPGGDG